MKSIREKNRIILEFDTVEAADKLQRAIEALRYMQIVGKSKATEMDIQELCDEINRTWWEENKERFIK
jgi:hypothetical protein